MLARIEPLAPAGLEAYRDGEPLSRMVADVDQLQDVALRLLIPVGVAVVASSAVVGGVLVVWPVAGVLLGAGLAAAAVLGPLVAARVVARTQRHQAALRARLTADLVDALDAADELWLNGADGRAAATIAADDRALEVAPGDARGAGRPMPSASPPPPSPPWPSCSPPRPQPAGARSTRCWWRPSRWSRWGAFEAVLPLSTAARQLPAVLAAGRRVLELVDRELEVADPAQPAPARPAIRASRSTGSWWPAVRTGGRCWTGCRWTCRRAPGWSCPPSGSGKTTPAQPLVRFLERQGGDARIGPRDLRDHRQDDVRAAVLPGAQEPACQSSTHDPREPPPGPPESGRRRPAGGAGQARLGNGWRRSWRASTPWSASGAGFVRRGQRQRLALARTFPADPSVLVLDEPTAHLDTATAGALLDDPWRRPAGRSVLLITHGDAGLLKRCRRVELEPDGDDRG